MQFYLDGYKPGDPLIEVPHRSVAERPAGVPDEVDVLIVGSGPAGLVLAAQMGTVPQIRTAVIDRTARAAPGLYRGGRDRPKCASAESAKRTLGAHRADRHCRGCRGWSHDRT